FYQAEEGIRDLYVTAVQPCALPIYDDDLAGAGLLLRHRREGCEVRHGRFRRLRRRGRATDEGEGRLRRGRRRCGWTGFGARDARSEERRVGKECRSWRLEYR